MRALLGFAALFLVACATAPPAVMIPVTGASPVEEQILNSYRAYAQVNASVGATDIAYSTHLPAAASHYQSVIQRRIERDLANYYRRFREPIHRAERIYLLFGVRDGQDLVEVVRLGTLRPERPYRQTFDGLQQVQTLTYIFDPRTRALISVFGPVAGEY